MAVTSQMLPPTRLRADLRRAAHMGIHGDTMIAHIDPREAQLLKLIGGVGTRNPRTGLPQFYSDSANEHARAETGGNMHDTSRPGGAGTQGGGSHGNSGASTGPNNFPGYRGPAGTANPDTASAGESQEPLNSGMIRTGQTTSYGAPVRVNNLGVKTALSPQRWSDWQNQVSTYNDAARKWNGTTERSFGNFLNRMSPMGFSLEAPDINRPSTYTEGDYHLGVNPAKLAASVLSPYGSSLISGPLAGRAYTELGGKDLMLSGGDVPGNWDPKGATPAASSPGAAGAPSAPSPGGGIGHPQQGGNPTGGGPLLPPISGSPGVAPPIPGAPPTPAGGSLLPPITAPAVNTYPGGYFPIPGPSPYGVQIPSWLYR